jgi:hypothetical protein
MKKGESIENRPTYFLKKRQVQSANPNFCFAATDFFYRKLIIFEVMCLFPFLKERVIQRLHTEGKSLKFVCQSQSDCSKVLLVQIYFNLSGIELSPMLLRSRNPNLLSVF